MHGLVLATFYYYCKYLKVRENFCPYGTFLIVYSLMIQVVMNREGKKVHFLQTLLEHSGLSNIVISVCTIEICSDISQALNIN